ncbi:hypothetical protein EYC84_009502 [Monilinia fructicola]|uniref:Glycosyl transferase family 1 domain-containing protein n=1 Tax=Monilinia fructicola TaxID=38448 RepID=A0A5M9J8V2_MONFR|nr:hypothetical protein EYC84_009502 [Monilinia fructicola]
MKLGMVHLMCEKPFDSLEQWSMSFAESIAVNSGFTKGVVEQVFPDLAKEKDLQIVHPCVDVNPKKTETKDDIVSVWQDRNILLSINRFEKKKDIGLAIKAYAGLGKHGRKGVRLVLAGGYDNRVMENVVYHKELVKLASGLGLKTATTKTIVAALNVPDDVDVLFLLSVPNTLKEMLLNSARLLIYTPSNEHFGIVPLEAMKTGWLCPPDDVERWTAVMDKVLNKMTDDQVTKMGKAGVERVKNEFSDVKMAERIDGLIDGMANYTKEGCSATLCILDDYYHSSIGHCILTVPGAAVTSIIYNAKVYETYLWDHRQPTELGLLRTLGFFGFAEQTSQEKSYSTEIEKKERFGAVVVGSGPAGLAVVGNLLEQKKGPVLWVDIAPLKYFGGGRLHHLYQAVPSNTKVNYLKELDQEKTCRIAVAASLGTMLGQGLGPEKGVVKFLGRVQRASWSDDSNWDVKLTSPRGEGLPSLSASSDLLFLCTGSHPTSDGIPDRSAQGIVSLSLDSCLNYRKLAFAVRRSMQERSDPTEKFTIAVIGASHSAILVLRNIYNLATSRNQEFQNVRIKWLTRHELRYAEERDGWIKRDNTGLKVSKYLEKVKTSPETEQEDQDKHLQGCNLVVHAIGFTKNIVPVIERDGTALDITYDHETSEFADTEGKKIKGLYGAGIAFPEKVVDPEGTTEYAVGLWKFMKYLKRVAPTWTA